MVTVSPGGDRSVPPTPIDASHPTAQDAWHQWWASGIPQALEISPHDPELLAWIRAKNDHAVLREIYMQNPVVPDRDGGMKANPLAARLNQIEGKLAAFAMQFGMTPRSRKTLGVVIEERKSLGDLTRRSAS